MVLEAQLSMLLITWSLIGFTYKQTFQQPMMAPVAFDVLTATAAELQRFLDSGFLSSVQLVEVYLDQIEKHNGYLKAVIATAPRASLMEKAKALDKERSNGTIRSRFHGLPILVKVQNAQRLVVVQELTRSQDNIATHPDLGMDTTAGSFALAGSRPRTSADVVERVDTARRQISSIRSLTRTYSC